MYRIEYDIETGLVHNLTAIEDASYPETLLDGVVYYEGDIPEDREGYTKSLFWGYDDNQNSRVASPYLYAVYTLIEGWLEIATIEGIEPRFADLESRSVSLESGVATKAEQGDLDSLEQDVIKLYYKGYGGHIIPKEFVDSWNYRFKKWGRYNEASGYFQFMQEDKITYPEAIEVIASGCYAHLDDYSHYRSSSANINIPSPKVVTISHWDTTYIPFTGENLCYYRNIMTVFSYAYYSVDSNNSDSGIKLKKNGVNLFAYCGMLKYINSTLDVSDIVSVLNVSFDSCKELIEVKLKGLNMNIRFKDSKNISKNSLVYMLSNRINAVSSPIVITLHNEAYNRLSNDADVTALLPATSTKGSVVLASI